MSSSNQFLKVSLSLALIVVGPGWLDAAVTLPRPMGGEEALATVGRSLPDVAKEHRMEADELRRILREDHSARLDQNARLFYLDDTPTAQGEGATAMGEPIPEALVPLDETFQLHSRPGASKIIFLDFDGHLITGAAWNYSYNSGADIPAPAWDIDGDPTTFSDTERTRIQQIWLRVAEDFVPFNVDVTTEYTGEAAITRSSSSDQSYGMRVLISPISSYVGNYGGVAYVGVFDLTGDYYKPALVFPEKLGNSEKNIAEAASHEAGHTLGLSHDGVRGGTSYYQGHGSGDTGWAPIMGVGYYKNLVQWSKGEYPNANNTQDDTAIIASYIPFAADDHGNSLAAATALPAGTQISVGGIIERATDSDYLRFTTGSGAVAINIVGAERGPNVDIQADLLDETGNIIASSNPSSLLTASFSLNLGAGNYYLRISGSGMGDLTTGYSNYGSLGGYVISGTVLDPSGTVPPVAVASASPATGDAPLNVQFSSSGSSDPDGSIMAYAWDFGDGATSTAANPTHLFNVAGNYTVMLMVMDNSGLTGSTTINVSAMQPNLGPTAIASASPGSGYAPLSVTLNGANSYDTDGTIVSYQWNFGDGATGSGDTVSHVYQDIGNYTATLTVTDDRGANSSTTVAIQSQQDPSKVMSVASISLSSIAVKGGYQVRATVGTVNPASQPVAGAVVYGQFSGAVNGATSGTTDAAGNVVLTSSKLKSGTVEFLVTDVVRSGFLYDPDANTVSSALITVGGGGSTGGGGGKGGGGKGGSGKGGRAK